MNFIIPIVATILAQQESSRLCGWYHVETDVEQEQNGLYTYKRTAKFDPDTIKGLLTRAVAIEILE